MPVLKRAAGQKINFLVHIYYMDGPFSFALKPIKTSGTLHCSLLLTDWFPPFNHTFVSLFVALIAKNPGIYFTQYKVQVVQQVATECLIS